MEQGIMDNFVLPQNVEDSGAREAVNKLMFKSVGNDVAIMSGHEQGTPYRFLQVAIFNGGQPRDKKEEAKWIKEGRKWSDSNIEEECIMPVYDEVDAVEFLKDRTTKPVIQVRHLGRDRLRIGIDGEVIGGSMADDYKRWKAGMGPSGTPLELWSEIGPGTLKTLHSQNILTVEQFAAKPREWVTENLPKDIQLIFEHLVEYVSGRDAAVVAKDYEARVKELEAELKAIKSSGSTKRKAGRPKKNE